MNNLPDNFADTSAEFERLTQIWKKETIYISSMTTILNHPAYLSILAMGPVILPLIFKDLQQHGGFWFSALNQLTGDSPVDDKDAGNIPIMTKNWIEYAKEKHYI